LIKHHLKINNLMNQLFQHQGAKNRGLHLFNTPLSIFTLFACFLTNFPTLQAQNACESTAIHQKTWALELTESGQGISFINRAAAANTVTVKVYNPNGTLNMTRTVSLAGYQTVTQYPGVATGSGGWSLPITVEGDPTTDQAYAMVATSSEAFSAMLYPDEMLSGFGTGKTAIWAQNTVNDSWFGMYNFPAIANNGNAREYFFLTNPSSSAATVAVNLYKSDGTALGTNPRTITVGATRTVKVYLEDDLNSSPSSPAPPSSDVAGVNQNISVHLTSNVRVNVQVYTSLGTDWSESGDYWQVHNGSAGVYVGYGAECNKTKYGWIDQKNGAQQTAARVTNPNSFPITIRETWYPDDTMPRTYVLQTTIPARGTAELPRPEGNWGNEQTGQTPNGKGRHYRVLESIDSDGAGAVQIGGFHTHVTYDQQIDYPAPLLTSYWWGSFNSGATDELLFINPHDTAITVFVEYSVDGSGVLMPAHAAGSPIIIPPKEALEWQISSDFLTPRTEPPLPSGDRTKENITYHYYSQSPFFLHLELTFPGPYGDLMPWDCGCGATTEDWGDLPDSSSALGTRNYATLVEYNGPSHSISGNLRMGNLVDAESDGNPSVTANNDDANGSDDEDGVDISDLTVMCGQNANVDITVYNNTGSNAYLYGWIDFDADGVLENNERQTLTIPSSATPQAVTLNFGSVPCLGVTSTFARFRLGTDNTKSSVPTGWGGSGEVEDYVVTITTCPPHICVPVTIQRN
jgi:GEVED domain/Family of unknown function (DUF5719)